jgi:hypothetical protein
MRSLPKPLIGLLLATVVFFALWIVALKPGSSTSGGSPSGVGQYQSAINQAHQAVATSNAANAKLGAPTSTVKAPAATTPKAAPAKTAPATKPATTAVVQPAKAKSSATAKSSTQSAAAEVKSLDTAVNDHKVVVVLFYNGAAADDQAMKHELAAVPAHHGEVAKFAVPVSELTQFQAVTSQIPVVTAPTLVVIDGSRQATMLAGFASQMEINQRVADALTAK